jgi:glycosyltransferase involved in cell wall biosynthesis
MDGPRVLVVARWFPHESEPGLGTFVHEQVRCLREVEGLDVRVVSGRECPLSLRRPHLIPGNWCRYLLGFRDLTWQSWHGVPVLYFPFLAGRLSNWLWQAPYRDALLRAMPAVRRTFPFDLIHAHTANPDGFAAQDLAKRVSTPLVLTEHTNPFEVLTATPLRRRQTLTAVAQARRVWCVSHSLQREVCGYFTPGEADHIHFLPNGVDTSRFTLPVGWRPKRSAPKLLFVGFLEHYKNPIMLLEAFAQVRASIPEAILHVAGDGSLKKAMVRRIGELGLSSAVKMHGYCGRIEVARLMREECDVFVLPSTSETFGVVLIEALACGKPVVATRCGGPESIVTDSAVGTLCPPNDAGELADALIHTIGRLHEFDPVKIRRFACDHFDYRILARNLAAVYREILGGGQKAAA